MERAWIALCVAFALHILDEAATGFLPLYNATMRALRARFRFLPAPTLRYDVWLTGLLVGCAGLAALTPLVSRYPASMAVPAVIFAGIMTGNGLFHIAGSLRMRRPMPGVYSAPLLLGAGLW